ncbi:unnamed protein product [Adineta ricciae]|uniref:Uncharacterized protein n=1 Tax=Adineta ricciae TaxID=249248 RepID=A0A815BQJ7_ADIRI|nr:unnamed protein product [Adineta ricciae]
MSIQTIDNSNQRPVQSQLVTRIYYPDTLYPDNYSFFADRSDLPTNSKDQTSLSMDPNNQYPTTTTDLNNSPPNLSTIPKQSSTEIETIDRQGKYAAPMIDRERVESETDRRRFDVKRYVPSALRAQDKSQPPAALLDPRFYSMKKTAMTILCLLIIVMSNSVQLKHVLSRSTSSTFYGTQVTLGIVSILMCASIGFVQLYLFLCTRLDQFPLVSPSENLSRYERILLILPAVLVLVLFILNTTFLIIMFKL